MAELLFLPTSITGDQRTTINPKLLQEEIEFATSKEAFLEFVAAASSRDGREATVSAFGKEGDTSLKGVSYQTPSPVLRVQHLMDPSESTKAPSSPSGSFPSTQQGNPYHSPVHQGEDGSGQVNRKRVGRGGRVQFPYKLYAMLDDAEKEQNTHIVRWLPGGKSFVVLLPEDFCKLIMPRYFKQTLFRSFQRQVSQNNIFII